MWLLIKPHVSDIVAQIIFPHLCFTDSEEEMWSDDPVEYVRESIDQL